VEAALSEYLRGRGQQIVAGLLPAALGRERFDAILPVDLLMKILDTHEYDGAGRG